MVLPKNAKFELLKLPFVSAEGVISALASVCSGTLADSANRACRAASFADSRLRSGGGEGAAWIVCSATARSSARCSGAMAADDWHRKDWRNGCLLAMLMGAEEALELACSSCLLDHCDTRNLFIWMSNGNAN